MTFRKWLSLALVIVAFAAERYAYFATRGSLASAMGRDGGISPATIGSVMTLASVVTILGLFAGAGASFALGPRLAAAIAAFVAALGYFVIGFGSFVAGTLLFSFGAGAFRVCPFAAAAELLQDLDGAGARPSPRRFAMLTAFAFFALAASYLASNVARSAGTAFEHAMGFRYGAFVNGALAILAAMLAGVSFAVSTVGLITAETAPPQAPYRAADPPPVAAAGAEPPRLAGLAAAAVAAAIFGATWTFANPFRFRDSESSHGSWFASLFSLAELSTKLYTVAGIASVFAAYLGFVVWIHAGATRSSASPIRWLAMGAILSGVGVGVNVVAVIAASVAAMGLGMALVGVGEPFISAPLLAFAAQSLRGRAAAFGVATVSALSIVAAVVAAPVAALAQKPFAILFALVAIAVGIASAVTARRAHRALFG